MKEYFDRFKVRYFDIVNFWKIGQENNENCCRKAYRVSWRIFKIIQIQSASAPQEFVLTDSPFSWISNCIQRITFQFRWFDCHLWEPNCFFLWENFWIRSFRRWTIVFIILDYSRSIEKRMAKSWWV